MDRNYYIREHKNKPCVLVVDDDEAILQLVRDILFFDYDVQTANNAALALDKLKNGRYDLLILDLGLPGLGGIEAIDHIRTALGLEDLPILVVSAFTGLRELLKGRGVQAVLAKPFSLDELEQLVAGLAASSRPGGKTLGRQAAE